ncbi:hypothetical protein C9374_013687 [Naegleria lovaniensis]|uniref:Rhodanese domain-containing protein n=1 Tax=Naegleria lovaniensis TaxID=51637 RepID=A0AA88GBM5_NAELO|nr:uncharacterized protein C9374_013687 [Naegleria lovaniensis]KAG2372623.1 hypothetical protein C9374_013687 [Naegleria lovaniensis]
MATLLRQSLNSSSGSSLRSLNGRPVTDLISIRFIRSNSLILFTKIKAFIFDRSYHSATCCFKHKSTTLNKKKKKSHTNSFESMYIPRPQEFKQRYDEYCDFTDKFVAICSQFNSEFLSQYIGGHETLNTSFDSINPKCNISYVTKQGLQHIFQTLEAGRDFILYDIRDERDSSNENYPSIHASAKNILLKNIGHVFLRACVNTSLKRYAFVLPSQDISSEKGPMIILYSVSYMKWLDRAAEILQELGCNKVVVYAGGIKDWWKKQEVEI